MFAKLFCFCFLFLSLPLLAQPSKKAQQKYQDARQYMAEGNMEKGIKTLENLLEGEPDYLTARELLIDTYQMLRKTDKAEMHCRIATDLRPNDVKLLPLYYMVALFDMQKGDYVRSKENANKFLRLSGSRPNNLTAECKRMVASADYAAEGMKKPLEFKPKLISKAQNRLPIQYFPVISADQQTLIFTGRVGDQKDQDENMYISRKINGEWTEPEFLKELNTFQNEGTCTISADGKVLIFTVCKGSDERPIYGRCDLFITYNVGGAWIPPQNLGNAVNSPHYESQPSLSADGKTLYFVSDRPGGFGQEDIWTSSLGEDGKWSKPKNLGSKINTSAMDKAPYIHVNGKTLFFSSEGHLGYGDLDIFKAENKNGTWETPENLGYPINDYREQTGMVISADGKHGFYSQGSFSHDTKANSLLYEFDLPTEIKINPSNYVKGTVFDAKTKKKLQAKIDLVDVRKDSIETTIFSDKENGDYLITLNKGAEYALYTSKEGYLFQSLSFDYAEHENKDVAIDIYLDPVEQGSKITLNNIFFDFNKANLLDKSKTELNRLLLFLQRNPNIKVEIGGHTDNMGGAKYNLDLSQKRAAEVVNYLKTKGIDIKRISSKGYGEMQPLKPNDSEENKAINRRIEFKIL
jgi:OOP family OmpA-OmpF porin